MDCSCIFPGMRALNKKKKRLKTMLWFFLTDHDQCYSVAYFKVMLVARDEGIFAYDPDEGNLSAIPLEGKKRTLISLKNAFFACVSEEGGDQSAQNTPRDAPARERLLPSKSSCRVTISRAAVTHIIIKRELMLNEKVCTTGLIIWRFYIKL